MVFRKVLLHFLTSLNKRRFAFCIIASSGWIGEKEGERKTDPWLIIPHKPHTAFSLFSPTQFLYAFNSGRAEVGGNIIHWAMPFFVAIELNLCVCLCVIYSHHFPVIQSAKQRETPIASYTRLFSSLVSIELTRCFLSLQPPTHTAQYTIEFIKFSLSHSLSWALRPWLSHWLYKSRRWMRTQTQLSRPADAINLGPRYRNYRHNYL